MWAPLQLFVVYMAYSLYAPHCCCCRSHRRHYSSSSNHCPTLPLLSGSVSVGEVVRRQCRAEQSRVVRSSWGGGGVGRQVGIIHLAWGFMSEQSRKRAPQKHTWKIMIPPLCKPNLCIWLLSFDERLSSFSSLLLLPFAYYLFLLKQREAFFRFSLRPSFLWPSSPGLVRFDSVRPGGRVVVESVRSLTLLPLCFSSSSVPKGVEDEFRIYDGLLLRKWKARRGIEFGLPGRACAYSF